MATTRKKEDQATVFTRDELVQGASAFGVTPEFMAGALYGVTGATKEEAADLVEIFKNKEV